MKHWIERTREEQRLLNPSFCSVLLWYAAQGHAAGLDTHPAMPFEETFLVLPMVMHRDIRDSLPRATTTSLAVWLSDHPLERATISDRARLLVPFTKEALRFGGAPGLLQFSHSALVANSDWKRKVTSVLGEASEEVRLCAKRAEFVGKWFAKAGNAETVLSIVGVRP
jgi:hypothetical protein